MTPHSFRKLLADYHYSLSKEFIAQEPASPRDHARLLVYRRSTQEVVFDRFLNITNHLPPRAVLVFNQTKVVPARLMLTKETGGKVRVLYVEEYGGCIRVLADRALQIGSKLWINPKLFFLVQGKEGSHYFLLPSFSLRRIHSVLEQYGATPVPPYIRHSGLSESVLREKYQTVFAKQRGAVAAPTASLHFTERLLRKIEHSGFDVRFVTLHVALGTFAPLTPEHVKKNKLHEEHYEIDSKTALFLNSAKKAKRPIIAVGTTVLRTLESAFVRGSGIHRLSGTTDLFIREGYRFKFVDGMVTNFHVPESSLLMLVAALVGRKKLFSLYEQAIQKHFRFFSFGDGMLVV